MSVLFRSQDLHKENQTDDIVALLSHEIISHNYAYVIINAGNFLLWQINDEVFPLIPELYEDENGVVCDTEKRHACFDSKTSYNTRFSRTSLEMGLNIFLRLSSSLLAAGVHTVPLLSVDDKYVDRDLANAYLLQGYKAIPALYRRYFEIAFEGTKNTKSIMRCIPGLFKDSGQKVRNEFLLSENELVSRFKKIRQSHIQWEKLVYKQYQESLPDKTRKCSLELFHLLKTLACRKDVIDDDAKKRLCIVQFVPDACEGSAMVSAQAIVQRRDDIDIISVVPVMTGSDVFVVTKWTKCGQELL